MKQRLLASAAMILIGSGIYAASTYYVPTPANETIAEQFPAAPLSLWTSGMNLPDARENLRNVEEKSGQNGIPTPSPEVLNFVQYFPEDADESDPAQSYGGRIFQRLLKKDGAWINSIYSYASQTPQQLAVRLGLSRERILGAYDPENEAHQRDSPDSWVIPYFQDIRVFQWKRDHVPGKCLHLFPGFQRSRAVGRLLYEALGQIPFPFRIHVGDLLLRQLCGRWERRGGISQCNRFCG